MEKGMNMDGTSISPSSGIFVMTKYPEAGKVKSRLAKSIGEEAATGLYRAFIQDTLTTVQTIDVPFHIAMYPPDYQKQFIQWLGTSYKFFPQRGTNLGERLHNGFVRMFENGHDAVIALASDCPDLPVEILRAAVDGLQNNGVVIGPSRDGGYYLIGFSQEHFIPDVFKDITWGTETVFQETRTRIELVTKQIHVLPEWPDIDTKDDLQKFYETNQMQPSMALHAMNYLRSHPGLLHKLFS